MFMTTKKVYKRLSNCMWTLLASTLQELITRDPWGRPKPTLGQKLNFFRTTVRKDIAGGLERQNLMLWGEVNLCQITHRQGRGRRLAQEEPLEGVGE